MLLYSEKIFDSFVSGTTNVYTDARFSELLASAEAVSVFANIDNVSGTSPTLTVQFENSPDGARWQIQWSGGPEANGVALGSGTSFGFTNRASQAIAIMKHVRLRIALGGTSPSASMQLYAVGRSPAYCQW